MSTPMSLFLNHIRVIKEQGFEIVDVITKLENQIMLTFDDGYLGIYKNKDFFIEQGLKPTVFLISSSIGKAAFLNEENILFLQKSGFRFQSHTHSHPDLNLLTKEQLSEEFMSSKTILERILSKNVDEICFPKGFFNDKVIEIAYQSGYKGLYSSLPGHYKEKNKFRVVFRNLVQFTTPNDLKSILYGGSRIYRKRYIQQHYHE
jgi:peptidoglycan/xylan/chitin deacetylase (PgdA/CDA1 family)